MRIPSDVEYMLRRMIGLAITDLRGWERRRNPASFSVTAELEAATGGIHLPELVFAFQCWFSTRTLVRDLLESIRLPRHWERETLILDDAPLDGSIDWGATLERWHEGSAGFVMESVRRREAVQQTREAADLLAEVLGHAAVVESIVLTKVSGRMPEYISQLVVDLQEYSDAIYRHVIEVLGEREAWIAERIATHRSALESVVSEVRESDDSIAARYYHQNHLRFNTHGIISNALQTLWHWREEYLTKHFGVGSGSDLNYVHSAEPSELYELWCFNEVCAAIAALGLGSVLQHSFLKARSLQATFSIGTEYDAYFDLETRRVAEIREDGDSVLDGVPGLRIEWFLRHRSDWGRSMCIDAKYGRWRSSYALTTLGYMNAFGVSTGVLFMPASPSSVFQTRGVEAEGLWKRSLPGGGTLWYCVLEPCEASEDQNQARVKHMLGVAFG